MILMRPEEVDAELNIPMRTVYYWMRTKRVRRYVGEDGKLRVARAEVKAMRQRRSHLARRPSPWLDSPELPPVLHPTSARSGSPRE